VRGYENIAKWLLENGTDGCRHTDALMLASENGNEGIVKLLLKTNTDGNKMDWYQNCIIGCK
jgi:hypothetical protein